MAFKAFFDSTCIYPVEAKLCPRGGLLSLGKGQKPHGAKYAGYGRLWVEFLAEWSRRTNAV